MWDENLLYLVFTSQILLISAYLPKLMLRQLTHMLTEHPKQTHPKLYPMSAELIKNYAKRFRQINIVVITLGLFILLELIYSGNKEMLNWDTQSVITLYWLIQFIPYGYAGLITKNYFSLMRANNTDSQRRADIQPRGLFDFVSSPLVSLAILSYFVFVALVIYFVQYPFDGFAGYWNILFVSLMNCFLGFSIYNTLYQKKTNPHEEKTDSHFRKKVTINFLVWVSIGGTLFIGTAFILSAYDLRHLTDIVHSAYFQLIVLFNLRNYRFDRANFNVYQAS